MTVQTGYCFIRGIQKQVRGTEHKNSFSKRLERLITLKKRHVRNDMSIHTQQLTSGEGRDNRTSSLVGGEQEDVH